MTKINKKMKVFKGQLKIGTESEVVTNQFTGKSVTLEPDAVAVYDLIMGSQLTNNYKLTRIGLDWFIKHYPKQYMVLLD
jgi:hypothetical protein